MLHFQLIVSVLGNESWRLRLLTQTHLGRNGSKHTWTLMCQQLKGPHKALLGLLQGCGLQLRQAEVCL